MARQSDLFSVVGGILTDSIPTRLWETRGKEGEEIVVKGHNVVVFLGDTVSFRNRRNGETQEKVLKPFRTIELAKGNLKPRISRLGDRAFSGTFQNVEVEGGQDRLMLTLREKWDQAVYVYVRTGWRPDLQGNIQADLVKHILDGKKVGLPGSFLLDGADAVASVEGAEVTEEQAAQIKGLSSKHHPLVGGPGVHHALYRLSDGASILGQESDGSMWQLANVGGALTMESAEELRPVFDDLYAENRQKVAKERAERRERQRKERLAVQEAAPAQIAETVEPAAATTPVE